MPRSTGMIEAETQRFLRRLEQLRGSAEERRQAVAEIAPFDLDEWIREAGPPTADHLREMEELLLEREEERRRSLARAAEAPE